MFYSTLPFRFALTSLLLISLSAHSNDSALDMSIIAPLGDRVQTNSPTIGDLSRECYEGADSNETRTSRSKWSSCLGFISAATQAVTNNGSGTCPPVSLRKVLNIVEKDAKDYESKHSDPLYDINGKQSGITLHPDYKSPWDKPALPAIASALQKSGCKP